MNTMLNKFRQNRTHYVVQSLGAAAAVFAALWVMSMRDAVIIASIGSTAFTVFAMPTSRTAAARSVVGGQLVGLLSGSLCAVIPHSSFLVSTLVYSLAVGLSVLVMAVTDTKHPPASGTALGVAMAGASWNCGLAVIAGVVLLSLLHHFLKPYLKDLV